MLFLWVFILLLDFLATVQATNEIWGGKKKEKHNITLYMRMSYYQEQDISSVLIGD